MNLKSISSFFYYLFIYLIMVQNLGAQTPLHQKTLPTNSSNDQRIKLVVFFSEIPAKNQPAHFYGAKGKVLMRSGRDVKEVGNLDHSYEIDFEGKKLPGVVGEILFPISGSGQIEIYAEISNRDGWKVSTIPIVFNLKDLRSPLNPKPINNWVSNLPLLPKVSYCNGIIHNTLGAEPCPAGTKPTSWVTGLRCPCVCCEKVSDAKRP